MTEEKKTREIKVKVLHQVGVRNNGEYDPSMGSSQIQNPWQLVNAMEQEQQKPKFLDVTHVYPHAWTQARLAEFFGVTSIKKIQAELGQLKGDDVKLEETAIEIDKFIKGLASSADRDAEAVFA